MIAPAVRAAIEARLGPAVRQVEIELSRTEEIDSAGLGALIALRKSLSQHHAQATLALREPSPSVQRLLQLTQADRLFALPGSEYAHAEAA